MSKNNNGTSLGALIPIFVIWIIYSSIDALFFEPKREAEELQLAKDEEQEMIKLWSKPTIDYFKTFDCSKLETVQKEFKINKFLSIDSDMNYECRLNDVINTGYENYKIFDTLYTRKINEANAIIWIVMKRGKEEGFYTGGEKAIRLKSEINFIDKKNNTIFKSIDVDYLGIAPEKITRTTRNYHDEEFGERNYEGEYIAIINEIKREHGLPSSN
jgi:hypothetical protein